jgi:hypothetical protein
MICTVQLPVLNLSLRNGHLHMCERNTLSKEKVNKLNLEDEGLFGDFGTTVPFGDGSPNPVHRAGFLVQIRLDLPVNPQGVVPFPDLPAGQRGLRRDHPAQNDH